MASQHTVMKWLEKGADSRPRNQRSASSDRTTGAKGMNSERLSLALSQVFTV